MRYESVIIGRCTAILVAACAIGCGGGAGDTPLCSPGASFCVGNQLQACNASGLDGTPLVDCKDDANAGQSPTNPAICTAVECPSGAAKVSPFPGPACCRVQEPRCAGAFPSTPQLDSRRYVGHCGSESDVDLPCGKYWAVYYDVQAANGDSIRLEIQFDRAIASPGQSFALSDLHGPSSVPMCCTAPCNQETRVSAKIGGVACAAWQGTVTWGSGVPSYAVSVDLQCAEPGKTLRVAGTISGTY